MYEYITLLLYLGGYLRTGLTDPLTAVVRHQPPGSVHHLHHGLHWRPGSQLPHQSHHRPPIPIVVIL